MTRSDWMEMMELMLMELNLPCSNLPVLITPYFDLDAGDIGLRCDNELIAK